jgi:predicted enzyme involved in methoxymalonyl-ACP biosynthesis
MEHFTLNTIVATAQKYGYKNIIGEYIPTAKNALVKDHYRNLGLVEKNDLWELPIEKHLAKNTFIHFNHE